MSYRVLLMAALLAGFAFGPGAVPPATANSDSVFSPSEPSNDAAKTAEAKAKYQRASQRVEAKDYRGALKLLSDVLKIDAKNADAWNLMGYSYRQMDELKRAEKSYKKALKYDPNHKGALEYMGELYLKMGELKDAEKHLAKLQKVCRLGCREYDDLKQAIADYKAGKTSS
jgi:Flp pilus assembly protein TadD